MILDHLNGEGECDVCCAGTVFINTEPKAIGSRDSFPLTRSILARYISFSSREQPTTGYLATEKKLESSDRPQWKGFYGAFKTKASVVFFGGLNASVKEQANIMTPALSL